MNTDEYYNQMTFNGKTMAEYDEEEYSQSQYELNEGISLQDAEQLGLLEPQQPSEGTREFEKLSTGDTMKDIGKSVGNEALKAFVPKKDGLANKALSQIGLDGFNEENLGLNYQARTRIGDTFKYLYRYGAGTIATLWSGGAVGGAMAASKVGAVAKMGTGLQKLLASDKLFKTSKGGLKAGGVWLANKFTAGALGGAITDFGVYRADEGHLADMFGNAEWARPFQTQDTDTELTGRIKNVVEGLLMGGAISVTVEPFLKKAIGSWFKGNKKAMTATTAEEAAVGVKEATEASESIKRITSINDCYNAVKEFKAAADMSNMDATELIHANIPSEYQQAAKEMLEIMNKGEDIFIHSDGTFDIKVSNWEDAAKVSEEQYKKQLIAQDEMKAVDGGEVRYGDTAIEHSDAAIKKTWEDRGWLGENDSSLIKTKISKDGDVVSKTVNQTTANKIAKNYTDKFEIDNKIKVEVVDGLQHQGKKVDGLTEGTKYKGKTVKNKPQAVKKIETKIEAQQLKVDKAQDKVTQLEGSNDEVMDDLEVAQRELDVAKEQLRDLKNDLHELQNPEKLSEITIKIDANCKNPHATLRAELEHARDIAKKTVPDQSKQHFSRYKGMNEGEVAAGYTHKKSASRMNAVDGVETTIPETTLKETDTIQPKAETKPVKKASKPLQEQQNNIQQLKLDFNSAEEMASAVAKGELNQATEKDIDAMVDTLADKVFKYEPTTWKELVEAGENEIDPLIKEFIENMDEEQLAKFLGNPDGLSTYLKRELGSFKAQSIFTEKMLATPDKDAARAYMNAIQMIQNRVEAYRSYAGLMLNGQKPSHILEDAFADKTMTQFQLEGINSLADIIENALKKVELDFTRGDLVKAKQQLMAEALTEIEPDFITLLTKDTDLQTVFNNCLDKILKDKNFDKELFKKEFKNAVTDKQIAMIKSVADQAPTLEGKTKVSTFMRNAQSYYVHNLLSGIGTEFKNVASGACNTLYFPVKKIVAGWMFGNDSLANEGLYTLRTLMSDTHEVWHYAAKAFKEAWNNGGQGVFANIGKDAMNNMDTALRQVDDASDFIPKFDNKDDTIAAFQNIHSAMTRLMGASDEFMSQLNYRSICKAKAYQQAEELAKVLGKESDEDFIEQQSKRFFNNAFDKEGKPKDVQAYYETKQMLYQNQLDGKAFDATTGEMKQMRERTLAMAAGESINNAIAGEAPALKFLFPFVKTGVNILQMNLDHNLLYGICSKSQRDLLLSGLKGSREGQLAIAQVGFGAFSFGLLGLMACTGGITGGLPIDPKEQKALLATGWRPYSIHLPNGSYWSYQGYEPLHTMLGFSADFVELVTSVCTNEDYQNLGKITSEGWQIIVNNFIDKAAFRSGVDALSVVLSGDEAKLQKIAGNTASGFLPDTSMVKGISTFGARDAKTPQTFIERWFNNYFNRGLGETRRNCFGEAQNVTNLIATNGSTLEHTPENDEILRLAELGFKPAEISDVIAQTNFNYKDFKDGNGRNAYDYMMEELSNSGLREAVRELVTSAEYNSLPDGVTTEAAKQQGIKYSSSDETKINALKALFIEYNNQAKEDVMFNHPELVNRQGVSLGDAQDTALINKLNEMNVQGLNNTLEDLSNFY